LAAEAAAKKEAEAQAQKEVAEKARLAAEEKEKAKKEAAEKARLAEEAAAKKEAEAAKKEAEARAQKEVAEKARLAAEEKEKAKNEAAEKARLAAEAAARKEAEAQAQKEFAEMARLVAAAAAKKEAEEKAKKEAAAKAEAERIAEARRTAAGEAQAAQQPLLHQAVPSCSPSEAEAEERRSSELTLIEAACIYQGKLPEPMWALALESQPAQPGGYVQLEAGKALQVQFVGPKGTPDAGYCYGKMMSPGLEDGQDGWFPSHLVAALPPAGTTGSAVSSLFGNPEESTKQRGAVQRPMFGLTTDSCWEGEGYLKITPGGVVQVLFIGSEGSAEQGYCFCQAPDAASKGWARSKSILVLL